MIWIVARIIWYGLGKLAVMDCWFDCSVFSWKFYTYLNHHICKHYVCKYWIGQSEYLLIAWFDRLGVMQDYCQYLLWLKMSLWSVGFRMNSFCFCKLSFLPLLAAPVWWSEAHKVICSPWALMMMMMISGWWYIYYDGVSVCLSVTKNHHFFWKIFFWIFFFWKSFFF